MTQKAQNKVHGWILTNQEGIHDVKIYAHWNERNRELMSKLSKVFSEFGWKRPENVNNVHAWVERFHEVQSFAQYHLIDEFLLAGPGRPVSFKVGCDVDNDELGVPRKDES